jgi:hypothetical protein
MDKKEHITRQLDFLYEVFGAISGAITGVLREKASKLEKERDKLAKEGDNEQRRTSSIRDTKTDV